jgi:hypothetical protein
MQCLDGTDIGSYTHAAVSALILVDFNIDSAWNGIMFVECLNSAHRAIGKASFAPYTFVFICFHQNLLALMV